MSHHAAIAEAVRDDAVTEPPAGPSAGPPAGSQPEPQPASRPVSQPEVMITDLLVEEVSIDGMCGVY
jgi:mycofactocin precursor